MGIGGTMDRDKCQDLALIHLNRLAWTQVIRNDDGRLHGAEIHILLPGQVTYQAVGNILDIRRPGLHVIIIHIGEHFREVITDHCYGIFCVDLLRADHAADRIPVIVVLQHHLMNLENSGACFAHLNHGFIV